MWLKIVGLLGLVVSIGLIGIAKANTLKRRLFLLEDYMQMVILIKGQINYFKESLPDIFRKIEKNSSSKAFLLLSDISNILVGTSNIEISQIWVSSTASMYKDEPITKEDLEIFNYLSTFIGQTDFENHLHHFTYLEEKLQKQIKEASDNLHKNGPMYRKMGFLIGMIVALLFL
jgi:stage III sporulation protein AB